jgi:transmembrane sensor
MSRQALHLLLEKYLNDQCSEEERIVVERLYGMLDKDDPEILQANELTTLEQKLWDRINYQTYVSEDPQMASTAQKTGLDYKVRFAIAASIALMIFTGYLFIKDVHDAQYIAFESYPNLTERKNTAMLPLKINLEDGSMVVLQPGSSLSFPRHFSNNIREVSLKGEGYFLISKNKKRPFFVYNDKVITRVVGTSFIVKSDELTSKVDVIVRTGKVMVFSNKNKFPGLANLLSSHKEVTLTPNQQTSFDRNNFKTTLVADPLPIQAPEEIGVINKKYAYNAGQFEDAPLLKVIEQLHQTYGINIKIEGQELSKNTFTGDLSDQGLYKKLQMICQSINAQYVVSGTQIVIKKIVSAKKGRDSNKNSALKNNNQIQSTDMNPNLTKPESL